VGEALSVELAVVVGRATDAGVSSKEAECVGAIEESGSATPALTRYRFAVIPKHIVIPPILTFDCPN